MSCRTCGHGFELYESMRNAPHGDANPCPACQNPTAAQDYRYKRVQIGFVDPTAIVRLPKDVSGGHTVRGAKNRRAVNKHEWSEICKRNDFTDVSGADPESWTGMTTVVPRETFEHTSGDVVEPHAHAGSSGDGETHRFTYTTADA